MTDAIFREIIALEQKDSVDAGKLTFDERSRLLAAACRDADAIEKSRLAMGLAASKPAPWPDSTGRFLAAAMRRVRSE
jgi:hypothetical protein